MQQIDRLTIQYYYWDMLELSWDRKKKYNCLVRQNNGDYIWEICSNENYVVIESATLILPPVARFNVKDFDLIKVGEHKLDDVNQMLCNWL